MESREVHALKLVLDEAVNDGDDSQGSLDDSILRAIEMPANTPDNTYENRRIQTQSSTKMLSKEASNHVNETSGEVVRNLQDEYEAGTLHRGNNVRDKRKHDEHNQEMDKRGRLNEGLDSVEDRCLLTTATGKSEV